MSDNELRKSIIKTFLQHVKPEEIQLQSFNTFISSTLPLLVNNETLTIPLSSDVNDAQQLIFSFSNCRLETGTPEELHLVESSKYTLQDYIDHHLTYSSRILVDLTQITPQQMSSKLPATHRLNSIEGICIGRVPTMVGSNLCVLPEATNSATSQKGYFIIKGMRKIVSFEERITHNYPFLLGKKKEFKFQRYIEYKSVNEHLKSSLLDIGSKVSKNEITLLVYCPELFQKEVVPIHQFLLLLFNSETYIKFLLMNLIAEHPKALPIIQHNFYKSPTSRSDVMKLFHQHNHKVKFDTEEAVCDYIYEMILINMTGKVSYLNKALFVFKLLELFIQHLIGVIPENDRDHVGKKILYGVKEYFTTLLNNVFDQRFKPKILRSLEKQAKSYLDEDIIRIIIERNTELTSSMRNALSSNTWRGKVQTSQFCSQAFDPFNTIHYQELMRKCITPVKSDMNKILGPRELNLTQCDVFCPFSTPDGKSIGLTKHTSFMAIISQNSTEPTHRAVEAFIQVNGWDCSNFENPLGHGLYLLLLNGVWIGCLPDKSSIDSVLNCFKYLKRSLIDVSINVDDTRKMIFILTNFGRLMHPLLNCKQYHSFVSGTSTITNQSWPSMDQLIKLGIIEYFDKNEVENITIHDNVDLLSRCDHGLPLDGYMDVCRAFCLGFAACLIPFINHNQSPRNIYQCQMSKQSVANNPYQRYLVESQLPIVSTIFQAQQLNYESPSGVNVVVAILPYNGANQEDSIVLNKASVERGLFNTVRREVISHMLEPDEVIISPSMIDAAKNEYNISKLADDGIVGVDQYVDKNDVIILVVERDSNRLRPVLFTSDIVMRVKERSVLNTERCIVKIILEEYVKPSVGDKFSSRHGQKGTIGAIVPAINLPFGEDGVQPDVLLNPVFLPSRMTIGHLLEMVSGLEMVRCGGSVKNVKYCKLCVEYRRCFGARCHNDCILSNTIDNYLQYTAFYSDLIDQHLKNWRSQVMFCGTTGEPLSVLVFSGPILYQCLKHISKDKVYVRTTGPVQSVTRQPKEGRSSDGGHRFGIQERDVLCANGAALAIPDRLFHNSDYNTVVVCSAGHLYHGFDPKIDHKSACKLCGDDTLYEVPLPNGSKVLIHELTPFNIWTKLHPVPIDTTLL
jgi:DNA-directed RNA polymerase beta subunit